MNRPKTVRRSLMRGSLAVSASLIILSSAPAIAQNNDEGDSEELEEIVVTGSQIRGAKITGALAVSVISTADIENLGIDSGDELFDLIPENGQNFLNPVDTAGGVNAARGDVGAINLRNLGTGNTLVLLNGRRLVNMATYQTEAVGGSFVPVNSVNSNHLPVFGVDRVEVLRDGASAIYGADAVAGVVNTVTRTDFEGLTLRVRHNEYDHMPRTDQSLALEWGGSFNGGATNVGVFARYYQRDRVRGTDEARWATSDFRDRFLPSSPYSALNSTIFRNNSANSLFGQFDVVTGLPSSHSLRQNDVTDASGEFEIYPVGDPRCDGGFNTGYGTCLHEDGQGTFRFDTNQIRDVAPEIDRTTFFAYVNHEFDNGLEAFGDLYFYDSNSNRNLEGSTPLGAVRLRVGAENYYNPLGPCGSPNRLPDSVIGTDVPCEGLELQLDNYRFAERPRSIDVDGDAYRVVGGLRGTLGNWDWEAAGVYSEATRTDIARNRVSNTLITDALFDPTPNAYNPFSGGVNTNIERAYVDVFRKGETTLMSGDVKFSNPEVFQMPAGPVGMLVGYEWRKEEFVDDRDPRLDGTIRFTDFEDETYPLTSDVVGSSPTPDSFGDRTTNSLFVEFQVPLHETLNVQLAGRYEDFDDVGSTTVGKFAFGWQPLDALLLRGSVSTAFRAPNLITINEGFVARSNTRDDWVCFYAVDNGSLPDDAFGDCDYSMQRQATGSRSLRSEESVNTSVGFAWTPTEPLTFTFDYWTIEKDDTIGLFGEENHILLDLVTRLDQGTANCASVVGNPAITRDTPTTDPVEVQGFLDAGLCPVGEVLFVADQYANLDTRTLEGYDIGVYYDMETSFGRFNFKWNGSYYTVYRQTANPTGPSGIVQAAQAVDPTIDYPLVGLGNLKNFDGNQSQRSTLSLSWTNGDWGMGLTSNTIGSFFDVLSNGDRFPVPAMTRHNINVTRWLELGGVESRLRLGVNNFTDERAPVYDGSFGFAQDAHNDYGVFYYADLRFQFGG